MQVESNAENMRLQIWIQTDDLPHTLLVVDKKELENLDIEWDDDLEKQQALNPFFILDYWDEIRPLDPECLDVETYQEAVSYMRKEKLIK